MEDFEHRGIQEGSLNLRLRIRASSRIGLGWRGREHGELICVSEKFLPFVKRGVLQDHGRAKPPGCGGDEVRVGRAPRLTSLQEAKGLRDMARLL